ncbi:hypothetical protein SAMN02982929_06854 [Saccharopolyspora kobensis]|uniref:ATP-binding protein n=1 Tax=Saccharopolyspora kobensis TaxID=146035 RepID=A0A1H6EII6_9PSEU|nr:hypothetical protein [Saccharopolyspora kobensis]SEG97652.1 hypothetical protein SAMN02982929_06854 [Saccharopolyspora kobensis]SFE92400.1 hypothetical protein SAMN05216506_1169 [Saccharopolyspora kobensis]
MKRTLTAAAAVLVSGAGAVGFAGAANAETPQLPAELPTDNNLAQTAFHAAGTLHSAQQTVGDVVPLGKQLSGRSGDQVGGLAGGALAGLTQGDVVGNLAGKTLGSLPVGDVVPAGQTLPAGRSGAEQLLPPGVAPALEQLQPSTPQTKPAPLPAQDVNVVGETVNGVVGTTPLGRTGDLLGVAEGTTGVVSDLTGGLPQTLPVGRATPDVLPGGTGEKVNDLLAHGPLGGVNQLGS